MCLYPWLGSILHQDVTQHLNAPPKRPWFLGMLIDIATKMKVKLRVELRNLISLEGDPLMVRRMLNTQPSPQVLTQRDNIFHTRCKILENTCSLSMDSGSCCNCYNTRLVDKLSLIVLPHQKPYKLHWFNEDGDLAVNHQVRVKLSIWKYKDSVLCDIVPIGMSCLIGETLAIWQENHAQWSHQWDYLHWQG